MSDEWRLTVKLKSVRVLREFMEFHGIKTGYGLAKKAGILPGTVNHLLTGERTTCSLKTARALEGALGCPTGFLFDVKMSQVCEDSRRGAAA